MARYRHHLPQIDGGIFLTDGGLETTLIFHDSVDLPYFAAFDLLRDVAGRKTLRAYYERYAAIARDKAVGFILESPTWRSSPDWGERLGYSREALDATNRDAIGLMAEIRAEYATDRSPFVISGCVGPRGDGYDPGQMMSVSEAEDYHAPQIGCFAETEADMVTAITITNVEEAIGVARAARALAMPCAISFTLETDGRLPTGQPLGEAIAETDRETGRWPSYFMINCAHPTHFDATLASGEAWAGRVRGLRANASKRSHAELDEATELDAGDPAELGDEYRTILARHPQINVLGGCCGTDHRHVEEIHAACARAA